MSDAELSTKATEITDTLAWSPETHRLSTPPFLTIASCSDTVGHHT